MENYATLGYKILMIFSVIDGKYTTEEGKVVVDFLKANIQTVVDIDRENVILLSYPQSQVSSFFTKTLEEINEVATEEQKTELLISMYEIATIPNTWNAGHKKAFEVASNIWGIEAAVMFESFLALY
jgi:hypothetical protein